MEVQSKVRRPWCLFVSLVFFAVIMFAGGLSPLAIMVREMYPKYVHHHSSLSEMVSLSSTVRMPTATATIESASAPSSTSSSRPEHKPTPRPATASLPVCGDGKCERPESIETCLADCPGVTTPPKCGESPHSDPGGFALADGRGHKAVSPGDCCEKCAAHAANPRNSKRPCNSWVFCGLPQCWSLDTGNKHTFGECWLKWQADPKHPLYGQRGKYSDSFRKRHMHAHRHNNLTVPTHVPWAGGIMGANVDLAVTWETSLEGMRSSAGEVIVEYRPWESREQNLKRGVRPESMF